ncbi:Phosphatase 2A regulatory B subunit family protein [Hibiscus syriacus]|uniref:Phosphatase 2A regulatory B subunit family protein n=1 Tax=Hibiscus syriacus TaxID=106335 RepID=A0A6A3CQS2_HIBSY|nr:Phosphatase 2A regulatory B subunit family protein [Hibiscus syriacus]
MGVPSLGLQSENQGDTCPLLMEQPSDFSGHVIDMPRSGDASSSNLSSETTLNGLDVLQHADRPSTSARALASQPSTFSFSGTNSRTSSAVRRGDSRYSSGCVATLPLLYWRYRHRNQASEQDTAQNRHSAHNNAPVRSFSLSVTRTSDGGDHRNATTSPRGGQNMGVINARIKILVEYLKMILDCFFAVWFVVGNVWIFGGHSSASEAPNMYREDLSQARGATPESIEALPTYKFKVKKSRNSDGKEINSGASEGGIVAAGTEKERVISGEDAVCCICLAKYVNNDELRELPCSHFMHKECVDKWLKINASCPLCKSEVGENILDSMSGTTATIILSSLSGPHDNHRRAAYSLMVFLLMCWVVVPSILYGCLTG